jgi:hypothetical protein
VGRSSGALRVFAFITHNADIRRVMMILDQTTHAFSAALTCSMRS